MSMILAIPTFASANTSVIVLGIRSVEGDDDLSEYLTGALRHAANQVQGWSVGATQVSLVQMSIVHGCDEIDAACMANIANELGQQRIIYGTVRRTGAGTDYDFALNLYFFNTETGQIEDSLSDTIPRIHVDIDDLRPRAVRYITQFSGQARYGSVRISVGRANANVRIDGSGVGVTGSDGVLLVEDVAEGQREVSIEADGFDTFEGSVRVVPDEQSEFRANLIPDQGPNLRWLPGVSLILVGAASIGVGISQWIPNLRDRRTYQDLESECRNGCPERMMEAQRFPGSGSGSISLYEAMVLIAGREGQACSDRVFDELASRDPMLGVRARDKCDSQDRHRLLSLVFNLIGGAAIATGTVLLIVSGRSNDSSSARFRLSPMVDRQTAGLSAFLEF